MTPLTQLLRAVKERLEHATSGPWEPCGARFSIVTSYLNPQENLDICDTAIATMMTNEQATSNAYLIAHAPTYLAKLARICEVQQAYIEARIKHGKTNGCDANWAIEVKKQADAIAAEGGEG